MSIPSTVGILCRPMVYGPDKAFLFCFLPRGAAVEGVMLYGREDPPTNLETMV